MLNYFNDPDDYKIADALVKKLLALPKGTETSTLALFAELYPGWDETDADLSSIDAELRRQAVRRHIRLETPPELRYFPDGKPYSVPFVIK